ncbi:hypothetical protein E4L96_11315 [Massilia arenosa]|uniref:Haem-binding uptake Tiki superfamily ChaN domain-containing protein n=1 Tax=Zemynaea arenosa TaxID=2561931 RepID=A0A4Y9SBY1_9BURK|nr:hypothetical protein [Massilia arenosa]TFW19724.1 hypothetical protein E4L96_11315 [Massilia arenosa]
MTPFLRTPWQHVAFVVGTLLAASAASAGTAATPAPTAEHRLAERILPTIGYTPRALFVGEVHGTEQAVAVFANIVQEYADNGEQFIVGLELPPSEEELVNRFLESSDDEVAAARRAMLASAFWQRPATVNDGRASIAMVQLLEYLRALRQNQGSAFEQAVCFQSGTDEAAAQRLQAALAWYPGAKLLTLSGNVHAMKKRPDGAAPALPAYFATEGSFTIDVRTNGGAAWQCRAGGKCGLASLPRPAGRKPPCDRCLVLDDALENFDAIYSIATPATASRPASELVSPR